MTRLKFFASYLPIRCTMNRKNKYHINSFKKLNFPIIDFVIVNLYPFEKIIQITNNVSKCINMIDVGGPSLLRSAAKNYKSITTINSITDYGIFIKNISSNNGKTTLSFRRQMAQKIFQTTAAYDSSIASWFANKKQSVLKISKLNSTTGRYGENPNRLQHYYQFQVIIKPSPKEIKKLYLNSLLKIGIDYREHDIRFVEDDWESPTLGAAGLGWEVWCDGMEITQFTYFQQMAGIECKPVSVELTYGLERICMFTQKKNNVFDLIWNNTNIKYKEIFHQAEKEFSAYNFKYANTNNLFKIFDMVESESKALLEKKLSLPAYDQCLKASHIFNLLEARGVISVAQRAVYISRIRELAKGAGSVWLETQNN